VCVRVCVCVCVCEREKRVIWDHVILTTAERSNDSFFLHLQLPNMHDTVIEVLEATQSFM